MFNKPDNNHRLYFAAIVCPEKTNEFILSCKQWMKDRFGCTKALKSPAHITLVAPFWWDSADEEKIINVLLSLTTDIKSVDIEIHGFSHFRKNVLFADVKGNEDLTILKRQTEHHFAEQLGEVINTDDRPFKPHITIATRDLKPSDFDKAWQHFSGKNYEDHFTATALSLLKLQDGKWRIIRERALGLYW